MSKSDAALATYPPAAELLRLAKTAIEFLNQHSTMVPTLWGPSSEGKTHFVRSLAREWGAHFLHVILQGLKPDDALGAQIMTVDARLVTAHSWWFQKAREWVDRGEKVVIFLDELDKVDPEIIASVLTFLRDRTALGVSLEDEEAIREGKAQRRAYVVAACNPGAMDEALRRRLAFIWWPTDVQRYYSVAGNSEVARLAIEANAQQLGQRRQESVPPPAPDFTLASVDVLARGQTALLRMSRAERAFILTLLMPREAAAQVETGLESLALRPDEQLDYLLQHPDEAVRVLGRLLVPEFVATGASMVLHAYNSGQMERVPAAFISILKGAVAPALDRRDDPRALAEALERLAAWLQERPDKEELQRICQEAIARLGPDPFFQEAARDNFVVFLTDGRLPKAEGALVQICRAYAASEEAKSGVS